MNTIPHSIQETLIVFKNNKIYNDLCIKFAVDIRIFPIRTKIQRINRNEKILTFINKLRVKAYKEGKLNTIIHWRDRQVFVVEFKKHYNILK